MRPPARRRRGRPREGIQPPLVQSHVGVRHGDPDAHERVLPAHGQTWLDEGVVQGGAARLGLGRVVPDLPLGADPDRRLLRFHDGEPGPDDLVFAAHGSELPGSPGSVRPRGHPFCADPRRCVPGGRGLPRHRVPDCVLSRPRLSRTKPRPPRIALRDPVLDQLCRPGVRRAPLGPSRRIRRDGPRSHRSRLARGLDLQSRRVGQPGHRGPGPRLHLAPVHDPPALYRNPSDRSRSHRSRPRPRRGILEDLLERRGAAFLQRDPDGNDPRLHHSLRILRRTEDLGREQRTPHRELHSGVVPRVRKVAGWSPGILRAYTFVALAAFYIPLIQVIIFSFNHDNNTIVWSYPSLRWYVSPPGYQEVSSLFGDTAMIGALSNSIGIGLVVTAISLAIGLPAALAIVRYRFSTKPFLNLMLYTGLMIPSIILGLSLLVFIRLVDDLYLWPYLGVTWDFGYASIIVGHVTFSIPIVIVVLIVSLREFDRSIEEAAMDLGANEITTFFRVTIPNIMPGIVSAALLAFTFSFSEVVVTLFLTGAGIQTLPILFWAQLSKQIQTPELNAASTLIIGLSIVFIVLANKVQRGGTLFRF